MRTFLAVFAVLWAAPSFAVGEGVAQENRALKVHLVQANNDSPYAFVRAKFEPGEVADPWAVRFFDDKGIEVPYFVWDSITWRTARPGRAEWGGRYALANHAPGDAAEIVEARAEKLQAAKKNLPKLGAKLDAQEQAAQKHPESVCAAMYLLRHRVPAFGKERLTLRIYPKRQTFATFYPKADKYDTVYNPVSFERGITSFWSESQLDVIGRRDAARFVAAQARWFVYSGQLLDTLETDNAAAIRASTHGGHTGIRNQIGIYLYDDFEFYRGLVGDLIAWSAASCQVPGQSFAPGVGAYRSLVLSNGGSSMLRWALDIRPGSKWLESKLVLRSDGKGARLQAWNRLPQARPTLKVTAEQLGLKGGADVLQIQLHGPAFRQPADFDAAWTRDLVTLKVTRAAKIRLAYRVLHPSWPARDKLILERRRPGVPSEAMREDVVWENDYVEWQAIPGEYDLRIVPK